MTRWLSPNSWRVCGLLVAIAVLGNSPASAQRSLYGDAPNHIPKPFGVPAQSREAGRFDYYALVLSWSPSYCAGLVRDDYDPQCNRRDGKRYSFVLHGLWPQFSRGYPESCPPRDRTYIQQSTIDRILDIMPSPRLAIHEYKKHGSCSGLEPEAYFALSRRLYGKIVVPPRFLNPPSAFFVSPDELKREFAAATPGLSPEMIGVVCDRGHGDRLKEIRICMTRQGEFAPCGPNEAQGRLCRAERMFVPPVRARAAG